VVDGAIRRSQSGSRCRRIDPIAAVLARLNVIALELPAADGEARFNHLYLEETVAVDAPVGTAGFEDPEFIRALDVVFAGLYFAATESRVKQEFLTGLLGVADEVLGHVDDVIAMWSITEARNAAWTNAEALRALRDHPDLTAAFADAINGTVGFASRGLLVATLPAG
jgi:uncharacterized protein DUF5995